MQTGSWCWFLSMKREKKEARKKIKIKNIEIRSFLVLN